MIPVLPRLQSKVTLRPQHSGEAEVPELGRVQTSGQPDTSGLLLRACAPGPRALTRGLALPLLTCPPWYAHRHQQITPVSCGCRSQRGPGQDPGLGSLSQRAPRPRVASVPLSQEHREAGSCAPCTRAPSPGQLPSQPHLPGTLSGTGRKGGEGGDRGRGVVPRSTLPSLPHVLGCFGWPHRGRPAAFLTFLVSSVFSDLSHVIYRHPLPVSRTGMRHLRGPAGSC